MIKVMGKPSDSSAEIETSQSTVGGHMESKIGEGQKFYKNDDNVK